MTVADLRGAPPLQTKIFSISCSFSENLAKSYVRAPLESWRPLLWGILDPPLYDVTLNGGHPFSNYIYCNQKRRVNSFKNVVIPNDICLE